MNVYILVTRRQGEDDFGNTCVFKSIRTGFPTARITVFSNGFEFNYPILFTKIEDNLIFRRISLDVTHDFFIKAILYEVKEELCGSKSNEPIIFLDPDIIFYSEVESYLNNIKELLAGRYVPFYYNEVVKAHEAERFHTSLLYIKSVKTLIEKLSDIPNTRNFPFEAVKPFQFFMSGKRLFYDTCANLYHSLPVEDKHNFAPEMLDKYTHLCCGSMLNYISAQMKNGERLKFLHDLAKKHPEKVQGLWKEHDRYYQSMQLPL